MAGENDGTRRPLENRALPKITGRMDQWLVGPFSIRCRESRTIQLALFQRLALKENSVR